MQTVFSYRQRKIVFRCGKSVSPYTFPTFGIPKHTFVLRIERQRRKSSGFFLGRSAHSGFLSISRCIASFSLSVLFRIQDETNETPVPDWVLAFVLCDTTAKCARAHPCNGRGDFRQISISFVSVLDSSDRQGATFGALFAKAHSTDGRQKTPYRRFEQSERVNCVRFPLSGPRRCWRPSQGLLEQCQGQGKNQGRFR